ncbi:MAG: methyltransferase family protein [Alphaproteobacteria bacterium]
MARRDVLVRQGTFLFRWRNYLPLLLVPVALAALSRQDILDRWLGERWETAWNFLCLVVALAGLGVRVATVGFVPGGTSGRNTREQRAATLNTTGFYSIVRNPLYLGNMIVLAGLALAVKVWWFPAVALAVAVVYYRCIIAAEEAFLTQRFGEAYRTWMQRTPRLWPEARQWVAPALTFSWRSALRREYGGAYLIFVTLTLIDLLDDLWREGEPLSAWVHQDAAWIVQFALGSVAYLVMRAIKKKTRWLVESGR